MFTGLIQQVGSVRAIAPAGNGGARLSVDIGLLAAESKLGDSIAVDGCCLTLAGLAGTVAEFDAVPETLRRTTLGSLQPGVRVNLECALRPGDRLGGHFVQGHVDTTATVIKTAAGGGRGGGGAGADAGAGAEWHFKLDDLQYAGQIVEKGSLALDGISLTVAGCERSGGTFWVAVIPETLARTTLGSKKKGARLNVETDILGKYVLAAWQARWAEAQGKKPQLDEAWLREQGY